MKICFFGLGSIGKKHLKNLSQILEEKNIEFEIHAYRSSNELSGLKNLDREIFELDNVDTNYDIVFITNPTSKHFETISYMIDKTEHMFIEKPIFEDADYNLEEISFGEGVYYIAAPLRYSSVIQKLKNIKNDYNIYSIRVISSSYLPDWRPEQDYRDVYSAKKELGGGVSIDLIHEWDYLTYLFGFPEKVLNLQGQFSHLEIDSEDLSIYIAKCKDKLVELHLDYFGRETKREIELFTDKGLIKADFIDNSIVLPDGTTLKLEDNDIYKNEMYHFFDLINRKKKNLNSPEHAFKVLKLIKESE
jgi:predicted dehydrogenase